MTHQDVLDRDIVGEYVAGRLPADARAAFEKHFFGCDECFAALQATEHLRAGVRQLAATGELQVDASNVIPIGARVPASRTPVLPWLLAAAAVVFAVAGVWLTQSRLTGIREELRTAETRSADLERALAEARSRRPVPESRATASPEANVPLAILQTTRQASGRRLTLVIPTAAVHFIVWLEDMPETLPPPVELTLSAEDRRLINRVTGLHRNDEGAIVASFPTDSLAAGVYELRLTAGDTSRVIARYRLNITRPGRQ